MNKFIPDIFHLNIFTNLLYLPSYILLKSFPYFIFLNIFNCSWFPISRDYNSFSRHEFSDYYKNSQLTLKCCNIILLRHVYLLLFYNKGFSPLNKKYRFYYQKKFSVFLIQFFLNTESCKPTNLVFSPVAI